MTCDLQSFSYFTTRKLRRSSFMVRLRPIRISASTMVEVYWRTDKWEPYDIHQAPFKKLDGPLSCLQDPKRLRWEAVGSMPDSKLEDHALPDAVTAYSTNSTDTFHIWDRLHLQPDDVPYSDDPEPAPNSRIHTHTHSFLCTNQNAWRRMRSYIIMYKAVVTTGADLWQRPLQSHVWAHDKVWRHSAITPVV